MLDAGRTVLSSLTQENVKLIIVGPLSTRSQVSLLNLRGLSNNDIISADLHSWVNQTIEIELVISAVLPSSALSEIRDLKKFILVLSVVVSPKEG